MKILHTCPSFTLSQPCFGGVGSEAKRAFKSSPVIARFCVAKSWQSTLESTFLWIASVASLARNDGESVSLSCDDGEDSCNAWAGTSLCNNSEKSSLDSSSCIESSKEAIRRLVAPPPR